MIKIKNIFFYSLLFFLNGSCVLNGEAGESGLSANIQIAVTASGAGETIQSRGGQAIVNIGSAREIACRRVLIDKTRLYRHIKELGFSDKGFENLFGVTEDGILNLEKAQISTRRSQSSSKIQVGGDEVGWMSFGISINNNSNFFLTIDSIIYTASTLEYKGCRFNKAETIDTSYCADSAAADVNQSDAGDSEGDNTGGENNTANGNESTTDYEIPFLYFVPPKLSIQYKPTSEDALENLKIYINGLQYIDHTKVPPSTHRLTSGNITVGGHSGASSQETETGQSSSQSDVGTDECGRPPRSGEPLIYFPSYFVTLIFRGSFLTKDGDVVSHFTKQVGFNSQSLRLGTYR